MSSEKKKQQFCSGFENHGKNVTKKCATIIDFCCSLQKRQFLNIQECLLRCLFVFFASLYFSSCSAAWFYLMLFDHYIVANNKSIMLGNEFMARPELKWKLSAKEILAVFFHVGVWRKKLRDYSSLRCVNTAGKAQAKHMHHSFLSQFFVLLNENKPRTLQSVQCSSGVIAWVVARSLWSGV